VNTALVNEDLGVQPGNSLVSQQDIRALLPAYRDAVGLGELAEATVRRRLVGAVVPTQLKCHAGPSPSCGSTDQAIGNQNLHR
jgi:hypothetical protein